jgi:tetratricopeptide (TPR) repeat protein
MATWGGQRELQADYLRGFFVIMAAWKSPHHEIVSMLGFAWLALKQAQEAIKSGRLEEAQRLLCQTAAQGHKRSWELLRAVGKGFVDRGQCHLRHQDAPAAWNDLIAAEQLGVNNSTAGQLRQDLAQLGMHDVGKLLGAGEPGRALEVIGQLRNRSVQHADLALLEEAARGWMRARDLSSRGEFAQAQQAMEPVIRLLGPDKGAADDFATSLERKKHAITALLLQLHEKLKHKEWQEVLRTSEQVLALAPQHAEAQRARSQAWKVIEPATLPHVSSEGKLDVDTEKAASQGGRFLLWIDGIGGYLVCLGNRVTLGQATPDAYVDIPLYADVSRLHATVARDSEGYLLEANRPLLVNGQPAEKALLRAGDRITLGSSCQLLFRQPAPVSTSARIDLASGHRLPVTVDGVVLMADTLIMNAGPQAHVTMPDLDKPIVLYRHKDELGIRYAGNFAVNGEACRERAVLPFAARSAEGATTSVAGENFAFAIEPVGTGLGRI